MVETRRANNVIRIPTSLQGKFFRIWIEFLTPLHNLTNREKDVVAAFIKARFELSKSISDPVWLDKVVMSDDTKKKVRDECNITLKHLQVVMKSLKESKVIIDGKINPKFIPKIREEKGYFQLLLLFELK